MESALQTMIDNMPEKTGKPLKDWTQLLRSKNFEKHSEAVNFLKKEHGVTHGYANTIVTLSKQDNASDEDLVHNQYKGKESLLPIYNRLLTIVTDLGNDVKVVPKKTSVSIVRNKQFALIKPATKTRVDLGLKLRNKEVGERLGNSGHFGTMCTHRVQLTDEKEVDQELKQWLSEAYEEAV